jgi:hypothetical protein
MANDHADTTRRESRSSARKFYKMGPDFGFDDAAGFEIENEARLLQGMRILGPPPGRRGFPNYPAPPRVLIDERLGRPLLDLEQYSEYWLISGRAKLAFETTDSAGFAFVRCETRLPDGTPGAEYWLCDVIRVLDAVDETASRVKIEYREGLKLYSLMDRVSLVFKEDMVGAAHVFRMAYFEPAVICDQNLKGTCEALGLSGLKFRDMSDY